MRSGQMRRPETKRLPVRKDAIAPDGSEVRVLLAVEKLGSTAHFTLRAREVSRAVVHKTVHEIWYVLQGRGEIWRSFKGRQQVVTLRPGMCVTLPLGTRFQFRTTSRRPLEIHGVTMPPWPNTPDEARIVAGKWKPTVRRGMSG
jgi:mannose-6-phosphate isomerase-like protein (cupin superfamily)